MLNFNNLNLIIWHKLTPAEQSFYIESFITHIGADVDTRTPDEVFAPKE